MEEVLSSRAYGRAIWNALTDRIIDRIPIARTLANWFGGYPTDESVAQWVGVWEGGWNDVRIHPGGRIELIGSGLLSRRGGKLTVTYVSGDTLGGTWEFESYRTKGTFEWKLISAFHVEGYRQEEGSTVKLRWNCFKNFDRE
jgi:hypothetical protein